MAQLRGKILSLLVGMQSPGFGFIDSIGSTADFRDVAEVISLELQVVDVVFDVFRELLGPW